MGLVGFAGRGCPAEVAVFEPVGVALDVDDFGVVDEPIDHGGGDGVVAEDFAPAAEGLVRGHDDGGAFVAGGDELEEQVRGFGFEGQVADLVDDQQRVTAQAFDFLGTIRRLVHLDAGVCVLLVGTVMGEAPSLSYGGAVYGWSRTTQA